MPARIQIPDSAVQQLLWGESISLSMLPSRVRTTLVAYALEQGLSLKKDTDNAAINPKELSLIAQGLPANPTIAEWAQMTTAQRESYPDEIFWAMDSQII